MGPQAITAGVYGPLPAGKVGLILGRSSLTLKGFQVLPGVIDQDYTEEIKVIAQTINTIIQVLPETKIAQIFLLPYYVGGRTLTGRPRGAVGFGSNDAVSWARIVKQDRPELELKINGKPFKGAIDTGADVSVIAFRHWPQAWPLNPAASELHGVRACYSTSAECSAPSMGRSRWKYRLF